jgi:uncharacterized membrane protein
MNMTRHSAWVPWATIAVAFVVSAVLYPRLPGPQNAFLSSALGRIAIAFLLPVAATVTYLILRRLWSETTAETLDAVEAEAAHGAIAARVVIFIVAIHGLVLLNLSGVQWLRAWGPQIVVLLFGGLFISIGNLLPRTRPNLALGIRTSRTLNDRGFWIRLHRTCGYVAVAFGTVIVLAGVFLRDPSFVVVTSAAAAGSVVIIALTYWRERHAGVGTASPLPPSR